jgi:hypothetical protein
LSLLAGSMILYIENLQTPENSIRINKQIQQYCKLESTQKSLLSPFTNGELELLGIPRWRLEVGSRKQASYSEILERRWRHTLQA